MGKRKGGSKAAQEALGPNMDVGSSRKRIRDFEDVADSDDEFHLQRDEVFLGEAPEAKRRRKVLEQEEFLQPSDEEVLDYSEPEEDLEEEVKINGRRRQVEAQSESDEQDERPGEDDEMGWGTSKADLYGADDIETEEQALEEEAEALRLQKKQLQAMDAADYGFDEADWHESAANSVAADDNTVTEVIPQLLIKEDMSPAERLKLLKSRYPEFEPLSKDLLQLQENHAQLSIDANQHLGTTSSPNALIKLRAASAYLGALTVYFSLLASTAYRAKSEVTAMSAAKLRDHPVMDSLVQCRDLWQKVQNLPTDSVRLDSEEDEAESVDEYEIVTEPASKQRSTATKSRKQRAADALQQATDARKAERLAQVEADLADLGSLAVPSSQRKKSKASRTGLETDEASDIGEEAPLTEREAADKALRKKSLRFYTSQIAQKANKRGAGGRNAGGDEDVPHRERLRDRQARLNAEAEKRGKKRGEGGADADLGGESDEDDRQQAKEIRDAAEDDDYYDMVAARTAKKKSDKVAFAAAQKQAALEGGRVIEEETVGADGKRKISYLIEKNKGLTPHRKKDVRNPRVKKRKKYDEKKKKLASMKPTYKGGEGRGGYGGELTGIKKGLVKSTKL